VGKPEKNRPLGRPKCSWEDNNKTELPRSGMGNWIHLAQDREWWLVIVKEVINLWVS
jgi:hypothetical protein